MTSHLFAACVIFALATDVFTLQAATEPAVVHRIYVAPMGQDHEAVRFRKLLSIELSKQGFATVNDVRDAEATLTTTLSTPVVDGHSRAYAEVALEDPAGRQLWGGDFPNRKRWPNGVDYVRKLAEEIAANLHTASQKIY